VNATTIMLTAIGAGVLGRWANDQDAVPSAKQVIEVLFALILIAALDQGRTESIARGFALLFLAAVLLSDDSPLTGLAKATATATPANVGATVGNLAANVKS
jgi:hypothetical protein